jgi:hypothetical protein
LEPWLVTLDREGQLISRNPIAGPHDGGWFDLHEPGAESVVGLRIGGRWWLSVFESSSPASAGGLLTVKLKHPQNPYSLSISSNGRFLCWTDRFENIYVQDFDCVGFTLGEPRRIQLPSCSIERLPWVEPDGSVFIGMVSETSLQRWDPERGWRTLPTGMTLDAVESDWYVVWDWKNRPKMCEAQVYLLRYDDGTTYHPSGISTCRCLFHGAPNTNLYAIAGDGIPPLEIDDEFAEQLDLGDRLFLLTNRKIYETTLAFTREETLVERASAVLASGSSSVEGLPFECQEPIDAARFWSSYRSSYRRI